MSKSNLYTVVIENNENDNTLIGYIIERNHEKITAPSLAEINEKVIALIGYKAEIVYAYSRNFIIKQRDDPEVTYFHDLLNLTINQSNVVFESAATFAKVSLNSLILLNGGAIIALLTFYGNYLQKYALTDRLDYLTISLICFGLGLILSLIACGLGFICQNNQATEFTKQIFDSSKEFFKKFNLNRMKSVSEALGKNYTVKESEPVRKKAVVLACIAILCFGIGSTFALISLHKTFKGQSSDKPTSNSRDLHYQRMQN